MTDRVVQVNALFKKELANLLLREIEFPEGLFVTITRVEASGNLQQARVYVSVIPDQMAPRVLHILAMNVFSLQQILNKRLKMRPVPKIEWVKETKTAEARHIEELLEKTKKDLRKQ